MEDKMITEVCANCGASRTGEEDRQMRQADCGR
jgi:hypothetical protein